MPEPEKAARLEMLQGLLSDEQMAFNERCIGQTMPVLFERTGRRAGQIVGRSPYMQAVHVDDAGDGVIGRIAEVTIKKALANSMAGTLGLDAPISGRPSERVCA